MFAGKEWADGWNWGPTLGVGVSVAARRLHSQLCVGRADFARTRGERVRRGLPCFEQDLSLRSLRG